MKTKELRSLNKEGMESKLLEMKKELMKINSQIAIGTVPKNPSRVKEIKKTIAKIHTITNQKPAAAPKAAPAKGKGGSKKE
jgi:large subunit ribosomal protein L29